MKNLYVLLIIIISGFFFYSCNESPSVSPDNLSNKSATTILSKASGPSASGQGVIDRIHGYQRIITFSATTHPDGSVSGSGQLIKVSSDLNSRQHIKFDIDCLNVNGNTAIMSGTITMVIKNNIQDPAQQLIMAGWLFQFKVVDNGEGANAVPDQITYFANWAPDDPNAATCGEDVGWDLFDIEAGNVQVKQ